VVTFAHAQVGAENEVVCGQVWERIVLHILMVGGDCGIGGRGCCDGRGNSFMGRRRCGVCWCELVLVKLFPIELSLVELSLVELFWLNYDL
jgi:hypothetical protein